MTSGPLLRWRWILLAWSVPALISVAQTSIASTVRPTRGVRVMMLTPVVEASLGIAQWMSWALITPLIFALVRRVPLKRGRLVPAIAFHVVAALVTAFAMRSVWYFVRVPFRLRFENVHWTLWALRLLYLTDTVGGVVGGSFVYMAVVGVAVALQYQRSLHERDLRSALLEAELSAARLKTLKMQLHPHFLFNTLHAVTVLIRDNPQAATHMVAQLGDLLRASLARVERAEVTLREELDLLEMYFEIETVRFHDRLEVEYDIDRATLSALVPDLLLQPLAENAIRHGVSLTRGRARIRVRSARDGDTLVVEVHDTGRGLERGDALRESVGLGSTRRRLETLYGSDQELVLERSTVEGGCVARVRIPFQESPPPELAEDDAADVALGGEPLRV